MIKCVTALITTLAAGWLFAAAATAATTRPAICKSCGPIAPTRHYKTVYPMKMQTHYRDVSVYKTVRRVHRITNVTKIQPIVYIKEITRIHHHTIVRTSNAYERVTQRLTPMRYVERSVKNFYDCRCGR